jgi:spore maturation protein SpmA
VLNAVFAVLILGGVLAGVFLGRMPEVNAEGIAAAKSAVEIAIGLVGMMALWLGFLRVLRDAGLLHSIARGLAPVMRRLFPEVPPDHPAMAAMILNLAANMLGLGNAATPFGLKAMRELDRLNSRPGVATDAMVLFLAINTSGVAVMPLGVIAIRASLGAENAAGIFLPSVLATACSTIVAILVARALSRRRRYAPERAEIAVDLEEGRASLADGVRGIDEAEQIAATSPALRPAGAWMLVGFFAVLGLAIGLRLWAPPESLDRLDVLREIANAWLLPVLMATIVVFGVAHRVKVYESFVQGAREGFEIAVMIIPFLVAILVAVGLFRASGALDAWVGLLAPVTTLVGFPAEALPMALIRPLSGSGAMGVMTATMQQHGPDSFVGYLVSVMNGSTETTFYVLALYFGSVRVRATRHAVAACLAADVTGVAAALVWSRIFF